jgi:hypothetical protein
MEKIMTRQEIDNIAIKYYKTHRKKYIEELINIFKPFLENKSWKLKRQVSDPAISRDDIFSDLIINFIHTLVIWNPKRKCSFKSFLVWHNIGNPVRARKRGGINYLFRKGKPSYYFTDFDSWAKKNGQIDSNENDEVNQQTSLSYYRISK